MKAHDVLMDARTLAALTPESVLIVDCRFALADATKALQETLDELDLDDDATTEEFGTAFRVEVKAKGSSREITDLKKVRAFLGDETFFKLATITLKDADSYLTPPQKEECIATNRTKRGFKIIERAA